MLCSSITQGRGGDNLTNKKVIVIGLDGGTWNIIKPLIKTGKLPTIAKLMKNGCYGNLESSIPPITFPAWKCYSTGKNPGKLGVYHFCNVDIKKRKVIMNSSLSFKSKELWDYLSENNISCGVLDMPTTYPPKEINGFMVSHNPLSSDFTYPKNLADELIEKLGYKPIPDYFSVVEDKDLIIASNKEIIKQRFDTAKYLLSIFNPQFFHITIFHIDTIQHYFWKDMEENNPKYGKVIEEFWITIDNGIKSLLDDFCDERTYVFLMSDHGFTSLKSEFNIAQWLISKKYLFLTRKSIIFDILSKLGISSDKILSVIIKLKIYSLLRRIVPLSLQQKIGDSIPGKKGKITDVGMETLIDWKRSKVIPICGIYINTNIIPQNSEDYEKLRDRLITEMENITSPTGDRAFIRIYKREEVYNGEFVDSAPDIVTLNNCFLTTNLSAEMWDVSRSRWSGDHELNGIFLAYGPNIKKGCEIQGARIYDIAPTILHIFGIPIPKDMDGKVLKEIFEEDSKILKKEITYQENEKNKIKSKIRDLKNLGKI